MSDSTSGKPTSTDPPADRRADTGDPARGRSVVDRRSGLDRRDASGLKRLRGPGRRRPEFNRAAEEGEFTDEQFLFVMAINAFKSANHKTFPTWTEVLEVVRKLGYRKTMASELNLPSAEDWTEPADAPSMPGQIVEAGELREDGADDLPDDEAFEALTIDDED